VIEPLRMHVQPALPGAPMLLAFEGWNDAGEAATSAVRYIEQALHSVPLAEIDCEEFLDFTVARPAVRLDREQTRVIEWPCTRFSYGRADASREIVLGLGVEPHLRWRRYSRPVAVTGFATSPQLLERIGVTASDYQGPTGIVGVLAERLGREGVEIVSLWAGLPHYISASPNPRGALALVQKLSDLLGIAIDDKPLRDDAAGFEERISALVAADPELNEYVRQLKRREFAQ
jgi:hypothetical protein